MYLQGGATTGKRDFVLHIAAINKDVQGLFTPALVTVQPTSVRVKNISPRVFRLSLLLVEIRDLNPISNVFWESSKMSPRLSSYGSFVGGYRARRPSGALVAYL